MKVENLRCEYSVNPLGVDVANPQFSWALRSSRRGERQTAYRVLVATDLGALEQNRGNAWDSGKVESAQSAHVRYGGAPLESNRTYFWKVRAWSRAGNASGYSEPAEFGTALLRPEDWQAKWIGRGPPREPRGRRGCLSAPPEETGLGAEVDVDERSNLFRREISIYKPMKRVRIHVCGLGFYELSINGRRIGDRVLNPAKTNYRKQLLYDTYDVTEQLVEGRNAIGVHLGNGWFNPLKKYWTWRMQWFGSKRMILQMHIDYEDGSTQVVSSDESWKSAPGPVVTSCIYDGESYDATREILGWDKPHYDDSAWEGVNVVEAPGGRMISQMMEPVKVMEVIEPVALENPEPGVYVYDMGQNFAGWARLRVKGPRGLKVSLRYAENVHEDGTLDVKSMNLAQARGTYILKGQGTEVYEPHFAYYGFRYVEMTGFPGEPGLENLEGCVVHSSCEHTGSFECSNDLINSIHRCTLWSQRSNLMGYPTDCPQRDERLGWLGDAHVTAEEAMLNFHMPLFYRKWLSGIQANRDESSGDLPYISPRPMLEPGAVDWSSGFLLIVWYYYLHYGDRRILEDHFDAMESYVRYLETTAQDHILPRSRYGDWCSVAEGWVRGDPASTNTAYLYYNASVLSKAAMVLEREDASKEYAELAERVRKAYNDRFFDPDTGQYEGGSQFSNAFPLFLGIVPEAHREEVLRNLVRDVVEGHGGHLTTGILGTKYMIEALTENGRCDVAYLLATQQGYPSWADMIQNRTTLSEHWDKSGSNNHVMFGSIDTWFYRALAGINIDQAHPGYSNFVIKPCIQPGLSWVKASIEIVRGRIVTEWACRDGEYRLGVTIPANSTATVYVMSQDGEKVTESGRAAGTSPGVRYLGSDNEHAIFEVGSGTYEFVSRDV
jgi:alpha-L-rhamnosidase